MSQGQRQPLCLAHAILSYPKIFVPDKATHAVDKKMEALPSRSIRKGFVGFFLLVITRRLSTVTDFNKILLTCDSDAAEYGTPRGLGDQREPWQLLDMCEQSGERNALRVK